VKKKTENGEIKHRGKMVKRTTEDGEIKHRGKK
jgi:hypothetical protein